MTENECLIRSLNAAVSPRPDRLRNRLVPEPVTCVLYMLAPVVQTLHWTRVRGNWFRHFFGASRREDLDRLAAAVAALKPNGALWVVRPKGTKAITEAETMAAGTRAGLVDVKVVSFSDTHTAEKFVIPVAKRAG